MLVFVDVASVISQYALEGEVSLGASWSNGINGDMQNVGGRGKYRDQPTVTYAPLIGKQFSESLMKPIPPPALFFLIQAGWSVDMVFRLCVQSINTLHNRSGSHRDMREADPEIVVQMQKRLLADDYDLSWFEVGLAGFSEGPGAVSRSDGVDDISPIQGFSNLMPGVSHWLKSFYLTCAEDTAVLLDGLDTGRKLSKVE